MKPIRIAINGASGRMGRGLVTDGVARSDVEVVAALTHSDHPALGEMLAEGVALSADLAVLDAGVDVLIDFSAPEACAAACARAAASGVSLLVGTTGLDDTTRASIDAHAARVPLLVAANTSLGVNVLLGLVRDAVAALPGWDVEITEIHHNRKVDAPSGTALALAQAAVDARNSLQPRFERSGHAPRAAEDLTIGAVRGGDVAGEHTVYLFGENERIELTHRATDRAIFIRGALTAAVWLAGRPAGIYGMPDVLSWQDSDD